MTPATNNINISMPSPEDAHLAMETSRKLAARFREDKDIEVKLINGSKQTSETVQLPATAVRLLIDILDQMAQGNAVTLMPIHAELTTFQAADVLNVSRPHLIKLLEEGKIPFHRVGTHRRVLAEDVLAYKSKKLASRRKTLDQLAELDQELGI
ncbi:MAG: helix-turn-helix domain-containing protein [Bacteroidota bacterium]